MSLYARLAALAFIALALAAGAWKCYTAGQNNIRAEWTAEKLANSENARMREQAAQKSNERIDRDYQTKKAADRAAGVLAADSLRKYTDISASAATSTSCGADDPRPAIASECAAALVALDGYGRGLAGQVAGLQGYAREVCVAK